MKKFLCLVFALVLSLSMVACAGGWKSTVTDYSGEVSSNGGFAVVKGDYVYYINGVESNTADNAFGTPVKGALVRTKVSELGNDNPQSEVVIPKLVFTNGPEGSNGFYIYGDYVYYTSPSTDKDKTGAVLNGSLEFLRTKLDGTDTTEITTVENLTAGFRYVLDGEKVYLVVNTTDADGNNVLVSYDATKKNTVLATSGTVQNYVFSNDLAKTYCYYVETAHNEELDQDESYQNIVKFNFNGEEETTVLEGNDGTQGATFTLIKDTGNDVYYSKTYVDTTVVTTVKYFAATNNSFTDGNVLLSEATTNASTIFANTSMFKSVSEIIYFDATLGFLKYDYNERNNPATYGVTYLVTDKQVLNELASLSVSSYTDEYVYMTDSSNYLYRVNVSELLAGNCAVEQMTYVSLKTSSTFYKPEVIGNYVLGALDTEPFGNYIYAVEIKTGLTEDEEDAELEKYDFTVEENLVNFAKRRIGIQTQEDATAYQEYLEETFKDEDKE